MNDFYIYVYYDPTRNNEPFYIGRGRHFRLSSHLRLAKGHKKVQHPLVYRIRKILSLGVEPSIEKLFENLCYEESVEMEKVFISKFGRKDQRKGSLLNLTDGGEGCKNLSQESIQKIREKVSGDNSPVKGRKRTPDEIRRISEAQLGKYVPPEVGKKIGDKLRGRNLSVETRTKMSLSRTGRALSEETIAKIKNSLKGHKFPSSQREEAIRSKIRKTLSYIHICNIPLNEENYNSNRVSKKGILYSKAIKYISYDEMILFMENPS